MAVQRSQPFTSRMRHIFQVSLPPRTTLFLFVRHSISMFSEKVVRAVRGRCEVFVDGGIRRGTDVLKALALGATAVFVGRPVIWGLAHNVSRRRYRSFAAHAPLVEY